MKFVDLFAGIGGFHEAAISSFGDSSECVATCEIDSHCQKFLAARYSPTSEIIPDISSIFNPKHQHAREIPDHDILFGGFPCQSFSNVGRREGLKDSRGILFYDLARVIRESRPQAFLLENVQKIITIEKGATLQTIISTLKDIGYSVSVWDLRASHYGLPQNRRRVFIAGVYGKSPTMAAPPQIDLNTSYYPDVYSLLERSMPDRHIVPSGTRKTVFVKNKNWMGNLAINNSIARPLCASMGKWHRANQDNYFTEDYVLEGSRPNLQSYDWKHENLRRITPLEGMRIQGFGEQSTDTLINSKISVTTLFKMIGNAVPVNLAESSLSHLLKYL